MINLASEKTYENKIKQFLKEQGCWYTKYFGCANSEAGVPDLLVCCNGKFIGIEVKAENGKPSKLQEIMKQKIEKAGGISVIVYPKDFDTLKQLIYNIKGESYGKKKI